MKHLDCGHGPSWHDGCTTGTAHTSDGREICWDCVAVSDKQSMIETGHSKHLPLYLVKGEVTNWPGTLRFSIRELTKGKHNIAGTRYDFRFTGPDGKTWHGVQYGEWAQIAHCKRIKG